MNIQIFEAVNDGNFGGFLVVSGWWKGDVNKDFFMEHTLLTLAVIRKRNGIVRYLVENMGANVNVCDSDGCSPLMHSVGRDIKITKYLISKGATIDKRDSEGSTVLHYAAHGWVEFVEYFISLGLDVNDRDRFGETPLFAAVSDNYCDVIRVLIDHGADTGARCNGNWIPLHYSNHLNTTKMLIEAGSPVDVYNHMGMTPLMNSMNRYDNFQYLISKGANPNAKDEDGDTVFDKDEYACPKIITFLAELKGPLSLQHIVLNTIDADEISKSGLPDIIFER